MPISTDTKNVLALLWLALSRVILHEIPEQDTSGPGSVSDSSKKDDGTLPSGSGSQAYLKKLHMQERAIEEVKLAIKPFYRKRDINKEEYKVILRKAVQKVSLTIVGWNYMIDCFQLRPKTFNGSRHVFH